MVPMWPAPPGVCRVVLGKAACITGPLFIHMPSPPLPPRALFPRLTPCPFLQGDKSANARCSWLDNSSRCAPAPTPGIGQCVLSVSHELSYLAPPGAPPLPSPTSSLARLAPCSHPSRAHSASPAAVQAREGPADTCFVTLSPCNCSVCQAGRVDVPRSCSTGVSH